MDIVKELRGKAWGDDPRAIRHVKVGVIRHVLNEIERLRDVLVAICRCADLGSPEPWGEHVAGCPLHPDFADDWKMDREGGRRTAAEIERLRAELDAERALADQAWDAIDRYHDDRHGASCVLCDYQAAWRERRAK